MAVQLHEVPIGTQQLPRRFERKYYLQPTQVGLAYGLLRQICLMDSEYPSEQINSLYFDTTDLDQYERSASGDFRKDKVRIRWYGAEKDPRGMRTVFLERKSRRGFTSTKQRRALRVPAEALTANRLGSGIVPRTLLLNTLASFGYFPPGLLRPVIQISYWRYRFCEVLTAQRISLDCHIRSTMIAPGLGNGESELEFPGAVIEIKGDSMELPPALRQMRMLETDWCRFSKYAACIDAHAEAPGSMGRLSPSGRVLRLQ